MKIVLMPVLIALALSGCVAHGTQPWQFPGRSSTPVAEPEPAATPSTPEPASTPTVRTFPTDESSARYEGVKVRRWSAVSSDLNATIELYTQVLGLELGSVTVDPPESYVYNTFNIDPTTLTRHATFHAGDDRRVISVVEYSGAQLNIPQAPRTNVLLLNANGRFDAIVTLLRRRGYKTMPVHALGSDGIELAFTDRDGHLYALYEIPYQGLFSEQIR